MFLRLILSGVLLFSISAAFPQKIKQRNKNKSRYHPPGTVSLNDTLFIDGAEVANIHYLEYLFYLETDSALEIFDEAQTYNDELKWDFLEENARFYLSEFSIELDKTEFEINYLRYPGFRFFPVVGISYNQALNYSKWRSEVVSATINKENEQNGMDERVYFHFRLPTIEEWEAAALAGVDSTKNKFGLEKLYGPYPKELYKKLKKETDDFLSFKEFKALRRPLIVSDFDVSFPNENQLIYAEGVNMVSFTYSNFPNSLGLYNMAGNVAEMTSEYGIAKGGSWVHNLEDCYVKNNFNYSCPSEWLGFRNVCDVIRFHKDSIPQKVIDLGYNDMNCEMVKARKLANVKNTPEYKIQKILSRFPNNNKYFSVNFCDSVLSKEDFLDLDVSSVIDNNKKVTKHCFQVEKLNPDMVVSEVTGTIIWEDLRAHLIINWKMDLEEKIIFPSKTPKDEICGLVIEIKGSLNGKEIVEQFVKIIE